MYLWVLIAVFLAALATVGMPLRPDMRNLYLVPQAQAVLTKLNAQHRALESYAFTHREAGHVIQPGVWNVNEHSSGYVPYGFKSNGGIVNFTSKVYCLNRRSENHGPLVSCFSNPEECCLNPDAIIYLVTYGRVPYRWLDVSTGHLKSELLVAMKETFGYTSGIGYTIAVGPDGYDISDDKNVFSTSVGILSQGKDTFVSIPSAIVDDDDFNDECASGDHCLIYMSTI